MSSSKSKATFTPEPPVELVAFVERMIRDGRSYDGIERREDRRYVMAIPIMVQPVDEQVNAVGAAFAAMTRDIAPKGIGLVHTKPIDNGRLALQLSLAGERVHVLAEVQWCKSLGPYYYIGGKFVSKLETFPT